MTKNQLLKILHEKLWEDNDKIEQETLWELQPLVDKEILSERGKGGKNNVIKD